MTNTSKPKTNPICPFCNAEWTDDMVNVLDVHASSGCPTCGSGAVVSGVVDITCSTCSRLIYRKEFQDHD